MTFSTNSTFVPSFPKDLAFFQHFERIQYHFTQKVSFLPEQIDKCFITNTFYMFEQLSNYKIVQPINCFQTYINILFNIHSNSTVLLQERSTVTLLLMPFSKLTVEFQSLS